MFSSRLVKLYYHHPCPKFKYPSKSCWLKLPFLVSIPYTIYLLHSFCMGSLLPISPKLYRRGFPSEQISFKTHVATCRFCNVCLRYAGKFKVLFYCGNPPQFWHYFDIYKPLQFGLVILPLRLKSNKIYNMRSFVRHQYCVFRNIQ